ncbi:TPR domain protein [Aspergillus melleus]|uniref:TPR domain protein n=1 Tax=Aspergillus melleus TaxID=138277 RepID=UPI001E8D9BCA|nr:uncharacterized protein LDX57_010840 [Aspergillus melleus]KAH8433206.1 hypothetical protein LDX57_010840 [Aspergillus melleus]
METHYVPDNSAFDETVRKHEQNVQNVQALKGQPPAHKKPRDQLIAELMQRIHMKQSNDYRVSFFPPSYLPCASPLKDLRKVMIKDLVLETHHRGTYVCLRAVTPAYRVTGVMAIAEDEEENAVTLELYNQGTFRSVAEIMDEGSVLIVKEPYLKASSDGNYGLRVDHPSDVRLILEDDEVFPSAWQKKPTADETAHSWKMQGNRLFRLSHYRQAMECYSKALQSSPTDEEARFINQNRLLTLLRTDQFDAVLLNAKDASSEKALSRKANALYNLQKFRECCDVLKALCTKYPEDAFAKSEFTRALNRLKEEQTGRYNFKQLQIKAMGCDMLHLDNATYIGSVAVKTTESRGRGLFTTAAVKAGDLLFCEKAFAHVFVANNDKERRHIIARAKEQDKDPAYLMNTKPDMVNSCQAKLVELITQKLYDNPSLMPAITDLHHGSYNSANVSHIDGMPVVDTFLVARIVSLNSFACPVSTLQQHLDSRAGVQNPTKDEYFRVGLWPLASYMNHSCYHNAHRAFIGDMQVVRATRGLEPDTEILGWYKGPTYLDPEGSLNTFHHWGFECSCAICQEHEDVGKSVQEKRRRLRNEVRAALSRTKPNIAKIEATLSTLTKTYNRPAAEVPRLRLWDLYLDCLAVYLAQKQPFKIIDGFLQALKSLGFVIEGGALPRATKAPLVVKKWGLLMEKVIDCWMMLALSYRAFAPDLQAQAEGYARISYRIFVGEDETFDETYLKHPDGAGGFIANSR